VDNNLVTNLQQKSVAQQILFCRALPWICGRSKAVEIRIFAPTARALEASLSAYKYLHLTCEQRWKKNREEREISVKLCNFVSFSLGFL